MEYQCNRFPLIAVKIFRNLDDESLVSCKEISTSIKNFLENDRIIYLRIMRKYKEKFFQFEKSWKIIVQYSPIAIVKEITQLAPKFFAYKSKRHSKHWHPLHIVAESGNLQLCKEIIERTGNKVWMKKVDCSKVDINSLKNSQFKNNRADIFSNL